MTPEEFRNLTQGLQAIFLSFAAVVGGIWVLLRFGLTRERARAQLDVERARAEAYRLSDVSCQIVVTHEQPFGSPNYLVYVSATLLNHGPHVRVFRCDDFPFHIDRVTISDNDTFFEKVVRLRIEHATSEAALQVRWPVSLTLFPDTPTRLSFHYVLTDPGSYMFSLLLDCEDLEAKSARDREELAKRKRFYDEYMNHPQYCPDPKADRAFQQHAFIGRGQIAAQTDLVPPA